MDDFAYLVLIYFAYAEYDAKARKKQSLLRMMILQPDATRKRWIAGKCSDEITVAYMAGHHVMTMYDTMSVPIDTT